MPDCGYFHVQNYVLVARIHADVYSVAASQSSSLAVQMRRARFFLHQNIAFQVSNGTFGIYLKKKIKINFWKNIPNEAQLKRTIQPSWNLYFQLNWWKFIERTEQKQKAAPQQKKKNNNKIESNYKLYHMMNFFVERFDDEFK